MSNPATRGLWALGIAWAAVAVACGDDESATTSAATTAASSSQNASSSASGGAPATSSSAGGAGGSTTTASSSATTTGTGGGGGYDEPTMATIDGTFTIGAAGAVSGSLTFDLYPFSGTGALGDKLCTQSWDFTATMTAIADPEGCDAGGTLCETICPFNDYGNGASTVGSCVGRLEGISGNVSSYTTDCHFANPVSFFHPQATSQPILERLVFSAPIEQALLTGLLVYPDDWGDFLDETVNNASSPLNNHAPGMQVALTNKHGDGSYTNVAKHLGITAMTMGQSVGTTGQGDHTFALLHHVNLP